MKETDKKSKWNMLLAGGALLVAALSVWGPELLTLSMDQRIFNRINRVEAEAEGTGYRYQLGSHEKLFILSECLNSQSRPESEQSALTRETEQSYGELAGSYAFVLNHKGPAEKEITDGEIFAVCGQELQSLAETGVLPKGTWEVTEASYEAALYSAIDVLEPRNKVSVWKVSFSGGEKDMPGASMPGASMPGAGRLMDAYIDADSGKLYEFYVRTDWEWKEIDPDDLIRKWSDYMGLAHPKAYETENPLLEATPYFKKYVFSGIGEENTIVTVGFYEGINELFLKVSR